MPVNACANQYYTGNNNLRFSTTVIIPEPIATHFGPSYLIRSSKPFIPIYGLKKVGANPPTLIAAAEQTTFANFTNQLADACKQASFDYVNDVVGGNYEILNNPTFTSSFQSYLYKILFSSFLNTNSYNNIYGQVRDFLLNLNPLLTLTELSQLFGQLINDQIVQADKNLFISPNSYLFNANALAVPFSDTITAWKAADADFYGFLSLQFDI